MKKPVLLVAEDSLLDATLMERLILRCGSAFQMVRVEDGEEAIQYLAGTGAYSDRNQHPLPDLFLLDLKMPRQDGFAVLQWRREHPAFSRLPVIVFSSSSLEEDINRAYTLGANSYVVKATDPARLERMVRMMHDWWVEFNVTTSL